MQHSGSDFEDQRNEQRVLCRPVAAEQGRPRLPARLHHGVPGNQACAAANQRAIDPANPSVFLPTAYAGNIVPGSGQQLNGITTGGIEGRKDGTYFTFPYFVYAPRAGFAWNVTGDGKTALRTSWGIFYNFPRSTGDGGYPFSGGCPISCTRQIRWAGSATSRGDAAEPDREPGQRDRRPATNSRSRSRTTSTSRSSATSASTPSPK